MIIPVNKKYILISLKCKDQDDIGQHDSTLKIVLMKRQTIKKSYLK